MIPYVDDPKNLGKDKLKRKMFETELNWSTENAKEKK